MTYYLYEYFISKVSNSVANNSKFIFWSVQIVDSRLILSVVAVSYTCVCLIH